MHSLISIKKNFFTSGIQFCDRKVRVVYVAILKVGAVLNRYVTGVSFIFI